MLRSHKTRRSVRRQSINVVAFASLITGQLAKASLLFDDISAYQSQAAGSNVTWTVVHPNTFIGDAYVLEPGAVDITGLDLFPVNKAIATYTSLQVSISIWGAVNTGLVNSSTPAFGDLIGIYSADKSGNFAPGYYYQLQGAPTGSSPGIVFNTPLQLNGISTIGITVNYEGSTGTTYQNANNLTSLISYGATPTVGANVFNGYYGNSNFETNGNFTSAIKSFGFADQSLSVRIFGDIGVGQSQWSSNAGGGWSTAPNWSTGTVPDTNTDAVFNLSSPNYTVNLSTSSVCKDLLVQSDNVTLQLSAPGALLSVSGSLAIGQPAITGTTIVGGLDLVQALSGSASNVSAGTVVCGGNGGTGALTVGSGVRLTSTGVVSVAAGSSILIAERGTLVAPSISLAGSTNSWTGLVDVGTSALDLPSDTLATATNEVEEGYNGDGNRTWNSAGGITSSAAANDSTHLTAVGVISNSDINGAQLYGIKGSLGMFDGSDAGVNDILVRFTFYGDANLDGIVDGSDYSLIDNGYLNHLTGWYDGDFNYDGVIDGSDYTLIDNTFNNRGATITELFAASLNEPQRLQPPATSIPEPTKSCLIAGFLSLCARRAQQHTRSLARHKSPRY